MKREANILEQNNLPQYPVLSYWGRSGPLRSRHQDKDETSKRLGLRRIKGKEHLKKETGKGRQLDM